MGLRQRHRAEPLGRAQRTQVCVAQRRRSVGFQQIGGAAREREEAKDVGREAALTTSFVSGCERTPAWPSELDSAGTSCGGFLSITASACDH